MDYLLKRNCYVDEFFSLLTKMDFEFGRKKTLGNNTYAIMRGLGLIERLLPIWLVAKDLNLVF